MSSPTVGTTHRDPDGTPHEGGRLVTERSGAGGVSDQRRAELERLEADAGTVGEDAQYSQRPRPGQPGNALSNAGTTSNAGSNSTPPIQSMDLGQGTGNPDIDKQ